MGLRQEFTNLSLAKQLQLTMIVLILLVSGTLVLITKLQLDWTQKEVLEISEKTVKDKSIEQIRQLAKNEAKFVSTEISSYLKYAKNFRELSKVAIDESLVTEQVLADGSPLWTDDCKTSTIYYESASYGSIYGKAENGEYLDLVTNLSRLNSLLSSLYKSCFLSTQQGFELNYVTNSYPGEKFDYTSYNPIVMEWYYRAYESPNETILTEPYEGESTDQWLFSISTAINSTKDEVLGVAGIEVLLNDIQQKASKINLLGGYELIVTAAGMIVSMPESWNISKSTRIYEESSTGFSTSLWQKVLNSQPGDYFSYTDINGVDFYMVVNHIIPYYELSEVTHYNLIMISKTEVNDPVDNLYNKFKDVNFALLITVIAVIITVNFFVFTLIYFIVRDIMFQFQVIQKLFRNIIRRALFTKPAYYSNIAKMEKFSSGIEDLVEGCKYKIQLLNEKEDDFSYFKWPTTRPNDINLYADWSDKLYPFNKYHGKVFSWSSELTRLDKVEF